MQQIFIKFVQNFVLFSSATEIKDTKYDKLNYLHNLIGSYLRTNGGQMQK